MPYVETEVHGPNETRPSPDLEGSFKVERILQHKKFRKGGYQFQILWKGYGEDEATWHREEDLEGAELMVEQYKNTHIKKGKKKKS